MALSLDGMAVLRAIAENRGVFSGVTSEAAKYGRTLVVKQLKAKGGGLETLQAVRTALGREPFSQIVDAMTDAEVKSFVGRVDRYHPELKTSNAAWRRMHLRALADGKAEPTDKPARVTKAKTRPRKSLAKREFLDLQSMKATRQRRY
jgi:hypothetical protein